MQYENMLSCSFAEIVVVGIECLTGFFRYYWWVMGSDSFHLICFLSITTVITTTATIILPLTDSHHHHKKKFLFQPPPKISHPSIWIFFFLAKLFFFALSLKYKYDECGEYWWPGVALSHIWLGGRLYRHVFLFSLGIS